MPDDVPSGARPDGDTPKTAAQAHPGLRDLLRYPLIQAVAERRTRRVARGTSVPAGELTHHTTNEPAPLTPLEEAVLIVATGISGVVMHDGPLDLPSGGKELGTPFLRVLGRTGSSPDNVQATSFFVINDEGIWLIERLRPARALELIKDLPPRWEEWSEADWVAAASAVKRKVYDGRIEFPRRFPYYHVWNKWLSNRPGTTLFMPIVDCTRGMLNVMLNVLSEPDGERALFLDDWRRFKPKTALDLGAWIAAGLGLIPQKIPYQPVGGIEWARNGFLNPEIRIPLGLAHAWRVDYEAYFLLQNLMLIGQAMGVGGWIHATIMPPYIYERDETTGMLGLGFRMQEPGKRWSHWPPVPAPMPNPVGIDGVLEGLCPPYVSSMDDAVDAMLDSKYGAQSAYGDITQFGRPYNRESDAKAFLKHAQPYSAKAIEYVKVVCRYIYDTYGRFPAHVDAFYLPGVWVQFSHLELEYYEKLFAPLTRVQAGGHSSRQQPAAERDRHAHVCGAARQPQRQVRGSIPAACRTRYGCLDRLDRGRRRDITPRRVRGA